MKKHLEHYGYFTGRNMAITRFGYEPKRNPKNLNSDDSDFESDDSENSTSNKIKSKNYLYAKIQLSLIHKLKFIFQR